MKRFFLLLGLLLTLSVGGAQATTSVPGCPVGYTCVAPSGKTDGTDTANIQAAMNASGKLKPPVLLTPGDYALCSPLTTAFGHDNVVVLGPAMVPTDPGQGGISGDAAARLNITSCSSSTFTTGQGAFQLASQLNTLQGFSINGTGFTGGSGINIDCIQSTTGGQNIQYMTLQGCYNGVYLNAISTGYSAYNQVNHIEHNIITFVTYGILCQITDSGNGCTDNFFNYNHVDDINTAGIYCGGGCGFSQIIGNRVEDGGAYGIVVYDASPPSFKSVIINDNYITAMTTAGIYLQNTSSVSMTGNFIACTSGPSISFNGSSFIDLISSIGNQTNGGCSSFYVVNSPLLIFASTFNDVISSSPYANTYTASQIEPYTSVPRDILQQGYLNITPSGTTFTPVLDGNQRDFNMVFVANSTIADFAYHVSGAQGMIRIQQDATGGRTTTWSAAYLNQPSLSGLTASTCTYVPYSMTTVKTILGTPVQNVTC